MPASLATHAGRNCAMTWLRPTVSLVAAGLPLAATLADGLAPALAGAVDDGAGAAAPPHPVSSRTRPAQRYPLARRGGSKPALRYKSAWSVTRFVRRGNLRGTAPG